MILSAPARSVYAGPQKKSRTTLKADEMAAVPHIEGAEAIDRDFERLHVYFERGLRSLGPVWSRETIWGHGVPFRYPSDPDIGPGLTDAGKALVRECNRMKIMIDLSHLNEKGFDDVAAISDAPLVATHSNAAAITPHARNLTDRQLDIIRASDGMVGINFASAFLRPDGQMKADFGLDILLRHFDHLVERLGEDRVGLGSDFDRARLFLSRLAIVQVCPLWLQPCVSMVPMTVFWPRLRTAIGCVSCARLGECRE